MDRERQSGPADFLPYLTAELPGVGGAIKVQPEDFLVEEIAAYEPCGEGEHLFLWIEKRDLAGEDLLRLLAKLVSISSRDIGMAGVKDRRAVTRQWVSVPARCEPAIANIADDRLIVLRAVRHRNKLRTGHLRGNRFTIVVRDATDGAADRAERIAQVLARLGVPNYFGPQRFGREQETLRLGFDLIGGRATPRSIPAARRRFLLRMSLSAVQSALFNAVLAARIREGRLHTVLAGDVMQVAGSGGLFVVSDAAVEQARFDARETVVTGPIVGPKMFAPQGQAAEQERDILAAFNLCDADFERFPALTSGTRRPLLVWPEKLVVRAEENALRLEFELASGVYATSVLREFMKTERPVESD